jgi:hypothetical protein
MVGFIGSAEICKQLDSGAASEPRGFAELIPAIHRFSAEPIHSSSICGSKPGNGDESFSCKRPEGSASPFNMVFHRLPGA